MADGRLSPLRNRLGYPLASAAAAMRALAQAFHAGKIVILPPPHGPLPPSAGGGGGVGGATIAITGGLGGLGLLVASWLVSTGAAGKLVLISRSGRLMQQQLSQITKAWSTLTSSAAMVITLALDPSASADSMALALSDSSFDAVIHAAGVLTDAMLPNQSLGHLRRCGESRKERGRAGGILAFHPLY